MTENKGREYCLIVEGAYLTESEAEHALRDPFIEDWVEQHGHFKIHNMDDIQVTPGVTLGSLGVVCLDDRVFDLILRRRRVRIDPGRGVTGQRVAPVEVFANIERAARVPELCGAVPPPLRHLSKGSDVSCHRTEQELLALQSRHAANLPLRRVANRPS